MNLKLKCQFIIVFLYSLLWSCDHQDDLVIQNSLSVSEVRELYNKISKTQSNGRETEDISILWDYAVYKNVPTGEALIFPVDVSTEKYARIKGYEKNYPVENISHAFAYKTEDEVIVLDYVQAIPTAQTEQFSGFVIVKDWNGGSKHVFEYSNGVLITDQENGRSESSCVETIFQECTSVSANGELLSYSCETVGITLSCHTIDIPPMFGSDDFANPGGGGNPSGSNNNNLCKHPVIEGAYIECGTCDVEGFKLDESGNCVKNIDIEEINLNLDSDPYSKLNDCVKAIVNEDHQRAWDLYIKLERAKKYQFDTFGKNKVYINNCADAFRHAFFGAMTARDHGINLARRIGVANECDVPEHLSLEKEMDLFNNEVGYQIGLDYGKNASDDELALAIWAEIKNGNLKYISNIDYDDSCFWFKNRNCPNNTHGITPESKLVCSDINCTDI